VSRELTDFTPFGYLRNTAHQARAWADTSGGNVRTCMDRLGIEWVYPVGRDATSHAGIVLEMELDGASYRARADFDAIGVTCRYHTCSMVGYAWRLNTLAFQAYFFLANDDALAVRLSVRNTGQDARTGNLQVVADLGGDPPERYALRGQPSLVAHLAAGEERRISAVLVRDGGQDPDVEAAFKRLRREDAAFLESCPRLRGDWPTHWAEGLHHDFQTTRALVQPPGGIFSDVWPAWMVAWPRVVFAEGTLDMLRLAYADPALALRAVATLLRDAPDANVPCVFRDGEYNMIAADGSRCGTSPAWCLPFLNLRLLYLRTLDRRWLAEIYPYATAYLNWWLENRTDPDGWVVYKCTWESGEDGNPRLDPSGSGDADISSRVRPVELQATVAHAASVMAFFAAELDQDASHWRVLEADYRRRTQDLFDPEQRRFRDWLMSEGRLNDACPDTPYWGIDPCRYSAQSLTPLLLGLDLPEREVWQHATPPWTLWPSWTWSLVESAAAAGLYAGVGRLAFETIDRVYRVTTRRELGSLRRPTPGCSPEFWPEDWRTYGGSDAYGWGATTANLLIRHLFGFKESLETDGWVAELTPAFPPQMLSPGAEYGIRRMNYRGRTFDLTYQVLESGRLEARLEFEDSRQEFQLRTGERLILRA
jgi:mannosylglycerate hydrolase MGH1-like protein